MDAGLFGAAAKGSSSAGMSGAGSAFGLWRGLASRGRRRSVILYYMLNDAYASDNWDMFPFPPTEDFVSRLHILCMCLSFLRRVHVFVGGGAESWKINQRPQFPQNAHRFRQYADFVIGVFRAYGCLLYTSPSPRDRQKSRMPSSA